jgi:hypothetical protein
LVLMTGAFLYAAAWLINRREQLAARQEATRWIR